MNQKIRNIIIGVVVVVIIAGGLFLIFNQKSELTEVEKEIKIISENNNLTEEQQAELDDALNLLKENPESAEALIGIARVKQQTDDYEGAKKDYLKALEIQPTNIVALNNLADIYNQEKEYKKSAEIYLRMIENSPKWISAYRELISVYKYHLPEKYPDIEQILLTGIEKNTDLTEYAPVDFYLMLGEFYSEVGNKNKAIEYFEITLDLMPEDAGIQSELEILKTL